jgi:8-oxo-dGTP pyrophosphatase MutT (NUDIX family)
MTVCYPINGAQIILGYKKVRLGAGLYNGFGGRLEVDEKIDTTAAREFTEESGLKAEEIEKIGITLITYESGERPIQLHLYLVSKFFGELKVTDEMDPKQFPLTEIPYEQMWQNEKFCLPLIIQRQYFVGHFHYDSKASRKMLTNKIIALDHAPIPEDLNFITR